MKIPSFLRSMTTGVVSTALVLTIGVIGAAVPVTAEASTQVTCQSTGNNRSFCRIDTSRGVHLQTQLSKADCRRGSSWGTNSRGVWVSNGCRAVFRTDSNTYSNSHHSSHDDDKAAAAVAAVALLAVGAAAAHERHEDRNRDRYGDDYHSYSNNNYNAYSYNNRRNRNFAVTCESMNNHYQYCRAPVHHNSVRMVRRLSSSGCEFHRDWGYDRNGIWVENGCRATFEID